MTHLLPEDFPIERWGRIGPAAEIKKPDPSFLPPPSYVEEVRSRWIKVPVDPEPDIKECMGRPEDDAQRFMGWNGEGRGAPEAKILTRLITNMNLYE